MKTFAIILAAAVTAGLGAVFLFNGLEAFAMDDDGRVVVNIVWFVGFVATVAISAAALGVLIQRVIARTDYHMVAKLENRIRALEQTPAPAPAPPEPD